ncbi:M2QJ, histidine kinase-group XI protein [Diplocarpon rosae]|nr:M2QJ, histidine kinase-group XI protein [Diplocarpon rosae]
MDGKDEDSKDGTLRARVEKRRKLFDWITEPHLENITPFQRFILDVDWQKSPLGPIELWPAQLRQMVLLVVQDPSPAVVYWGDDATIVYNQAYTKLIGRKHPALQGQDPSIEFAEIWSHFEELLARQRETAQTTVEANAFLLLFRHGFLEESFFSWKFVPIIGSEGWVVGSHATVVETTREVIGDRRLSVVQDLTRELSSSRSIRDLWVRLLRGIENAPKDIPVALLYSVADSSISSGRKNVSNRNGDDSSPGCVLEGAVGIPAGHELAPAFVDIEGTDTYLASAMRRASREMSPVVVPMTPKTEGSFDGIEWRGFGVPPTHIGVYPIIPTDSDNVLALLAVGLNPRRPYDEDYRNFLVTLTQQVTTPQLSAVILREEVERRQLLARKEALDRDRLSKELSDDETKFARFATRAPVGLAILSPDGSALSANDLWRDLTQLAVGSNKVAWEKVLADGELEVVNSLWEQLLTEHRPTTMQIRMKRRWLVPELDAEHKEQWSDTHIMLTLYPDFDSHNNLSTIMSCVTDISAIKWSETQLRQKMTQAIELRKAQERYIDLTSHEMRNPLSALIGCADEILASLNEIRLSLKSTPPECVQSDTRKTYQLLSEATEAADTIIYCAMHQKRIIDDILTLSKLDSNLLHVSPEPSQPLELVRGGLKMFEAELKRAETTLEFVQEDTLNSLQAHWTLLDPSRVLQVLINLMTNAIKFTRTEPTRHIKITMGASSSEPTEPNAYGVKYVRKGGSNPDQTAKPEWGDGEVIYLCITVQDTGRGLDETEITNLFHLFAQASPKTYQTYGGSGLGLFICRQLVEMQGGQIGVLPPCSPPQAFFNLFKKKQLLTPSFKTSARGEGSTFQFYIKTRRTTPKTSPQQDLPVLVRDDALREACAVETSGLQNGGVTEQKQPEYPPASGSHASHEALHILVVEDNLVNQKVIRKQLIKSGHVVSVANHGQEALDFIRKSEFWQEQDGETPHQLSLVLMDLEMPIMNGLTAVKRIRESQADGDICGQ